MITLYVSQSQLNIFFDNTVYRIQVIGSNQENGDLLYAVDGDLQQFEADYPQVKEYYEGDWFLNFYPDAVGNTPLEKYLNAINSMKGLDSPK